MNYHQFQLHYYQTEKEKKQNKNKQKTTSQGNISQPGNPKVAIIDVL